MGVVTQIKDLDNTSASLRIYNVAERMVKLNSHHIYSFGNKIFQKSKPIFPTEIINFPLSIINYKKPASKQTLENRQIYII